jgi:hypothetical protein
MKFTALPHENILFPVPYAENEEHKIIITNQRLVQRNPAGATEVPTKDIHFVGRQVIRPRLAAGIVFILFAIPILIYGGYEIYSVWGYTAASPLSLVGIKDDDAAQQAAAANAETPPEGEDAVDWPRTVLIHRILGAICILAAIGCALLARKLIKKKRFFVVCRGVRRMLKIEAKDEIQQTQIMVTVSAVKGKAPGK